MPLLNRGAIANFFGLADEEEYEYQDYPETTKRLYSQLKIQHRINQLILYLLRILMKNKNGDFTSCNA